MRKKTILISIAAITLVAFGMVSSAYAFADPVSISIVLGAGFITLVTAVESIKQTKAVTAQKQTKELQTKQKAGDLAPAPSLVTQTAVQPAR